MEVSGIPQSALPIPMKASKKIPKSAEDLSLHLMGTGSLVRAIADESLVL
jgi:hypothetical protein